MIRLGALHRGKAGARMAALYFCEIKAVVFVMTSFFVTEVNLLSSHHCTLKQKLDCKENLINDGQQRHYEANTRHSSCGQLRYLFSPLMPLCSHIKSPLTSALKKVLLTTSSKCGTIQ